jgi:uncharacterized protein (DUF58 family)
MAILAAGFGAALLPVVIDLRLWPIWAAYCSLAVVGLIIDALLSPWRHHVDARLVIPETMFVGEEHEAELQIVTAYGRTLKAAALLDLSTELAGPDAVPIQLSLHESVASVTVRPVRRGLATVEGLWIRYSGPFGLCQRTLHQPLEQTARVVPSIRAVRAAALSFSMPAEHMVGLKIERFAGVGSEYHAMREYVPGLDSRWIDWKASARHTRLLCREYRAERNHHIVFAIDTGRLMAEEINGIPRLDHAIHAALTLAFISLRSGDRVSLFSFEATPCQLSPPNSGVGSFPALLQLSAELAYTAAETNFTLGLTQLLVELRRRSLVVVLTDFIDTVTADLMIENVLRVSQRHLVVFTALRNPLFDEIECLEPRSIHDIERAVVASSLARERKLVMRRLRRAGVHCIDTVPAGLGPQLINRYLEVKRREMI